MMTPQQACQYDVQGIDCLSPVGSATMHTARRSYIRTGLRSDEPF